MSGAIQTSAILAGILMLAASMPALAARPADRPIPTLGESRLFWTMQADGQTFRKVRATLRHDGRLARIWVDDRDSDRIGSEVIEKIAGGLESATGPDSRDPHKGILENEWDVFGNSPKTWQIGGKDDFLMLDLPNTVPGMTLLGYFHTKDQYPSSIVPASNEMNLLYIDSREGIRDIPQLMGTIAHEYQHLIGFGRNPKSDRFYSEALSELAALLTGYRHPNTSFLASPNTPLFRWADNDADKIEVDYQRGMSLMYYLHEQYGDKFIRELVAAPGGGMERIEEALDRAGVPDNERSEARLMAGFAVANYLQGEGSGAFGYKVPLPTTQRLVRPVAVSAQDLQSNGLPTAATLEPYGFAFVDYKRPEPGLRLQADAPGQVVMAIVYGGGARRIIEVGPDGLDLATMGQIDRVILALVNLADARHVVRWTASNGGSVALR